MVPVCLYRIAAQQRGLPITLQILQASWREGGALVTHPMTLTHARGVITLIRPKGTIILRGSTGGSPISRPSTHNGTWDVYGAKTSERMNRYTYDYEPPYKYPAGSNGREWPSGVTAPDVNTVCVDCHGLPWRSVVSTRYGYLEVVTGGGPHGTYRSTTHNPYYGGLIDPYENWDFVTLMCTDCHEPHGSPNEFLLRTCVNGKNNIVITQPGHYREFCTACHWLGSFHSSDNDCTGCHYHPVNL